MKSLFVSAGEASGDRIAAMTLQALADVGNPVQAFGMGGDGCAEAGMNVIVPFGDVATMGWLPVAGKAWALQRAFRTVLSVVRRRRPCLALLVGFTSFHQALGRRLRALGVRVLWCVAPQVWAWRPSRLVTLRRSVDRLAVLFPFEEPLWCGHGYDVRYVGHPAVELTTAREGGERPLRLALLMGSRVQEVRATAGPFVEAARAWQRGNADWEVEAVVSPALPSRWRQWLVERVNAAGMRHVMADKRDGAAARMQQYGLALCASGTACLEAALSGVPPVIGYRCDPLSAFVARRLLLTPHIGLPNVLLGERVFPELVQGDLRPDRIMAALSGLREDERARAACRRVRELLVLNDGLSFGRRVAGMVGEMAWSN